MTLAKPTGILLEQHVANVYEELGRIFIMRPFLAQKFFKTGMNLRELAELAVQWHDEGKKHPKWQNACIKDYEETNRIGKKQGSHLRNAHIRHEMESLHLTENKELPELVQVAIAAHHGKLSWKYEDRWKGDEKRRYEKFWNTFVDLSDEYSDQLEQIIIERYNYAAVRTLLQLADRRASAVEGTDKKPIELKNFEYSFTYNKPKGVQKEIQKLQHLPFAILRAPTGSGKTDAALLWAQHQIKEQKADRLIIAMPTRFTANALSVGITERLSQTGLYHSTSFYQIAKGKNLTDDEKEVIINEQQLARTLNSPVTVTTIDHLCMCLTGTREEHHTIFYHLAHSCVVIDEADFYDEFTQQNIIDLLNILRILGVPVLVMSATIPDSAIELYKKSGFTIDTIFDVSDNENSDVIRVTIGEKKSAYVAEDISDLLLSAFNQPTIIYANTVKRAQMYYRFLMSHKENNNLDTDIVIYHSRYTEPDKVKKEEKLIDIMGKEAWKTNSAHGIAILTQIGELSVNISGEVMISEWCPIDRLVQRIGRLMRFTEIHKEKIGILHLIQPLQEDGTLYPAPYGSLGKKNGWVASPYLQATIDQLTQPHYTVMELRNLVNKIYEGLQDITREVKENSRALYKLLQMNWLIVSGHETDADDTDADGWKSRKIPPQKMVYITEEEICYSDDTDYSFPSWKERNEFDITNGINIPMYEFHKEVENEHIQKQPYKIGLYDKEDLYIVQKRFYDGNGVGLHFDHNGDDE